MKCLYAKKSLASLFLGLNRFKFQKRVIILHIEPYGLHRDHPRAKAISYPAKMEISQISPARTSFRLFLSSRYEWNSKNLLQTLAMADHLQSLIK